MGSTAKAHQGGGWLKALILSAVFSLVTFSCTKPPALENFKEQPEVLAGKWQGVGTMRLAAISPAISYLALAGSTPLAVRVKIKPGPGCSKVGVLGSFRSPVAYHGLVVTPGHLRYVRRSGNETITPGPAAIPLAADTWQSGFTMEVKLGRSIIRGSLLDSIAPISWSSPRAATGRTVLFANGPASFFIEQTTPLTRVLPVTPAIQLLRHFPAQPPRGDIGELLQASLAKLQRHPEQAAPADLAAAWLWTGNTFYRKHLLKHPAQNGNAINRILWLLSLRTCQTPLPGQTRLRQAAGELVGQVEKNKGNTPPGKTLESLPLPGPALIMAETRLLGDLRKQAFKAERTLRDRLNRLMVAGHCQNWPAKRLIETIAWLDQAGSRGHAMAASLHNLILERHVEIAPQGLVIARDGKPDYPGTMHWILHLAKTEDLAPVAAWTALAIAKSKAAPPFSLLIAHLRLNPTLAPHPTMALLSTTGTVDQLKKTTTTLTWATTGPARETILIPPQKARLLKDGKEEPITGPLVQVTHNQPEILVILNLVQNHQLQSSPGQ